MARQVVQFGFVFHFSCADVTRITQKDTLFFATLNSFSVQHCTSLAEQQEWAVPENNCYRSVNSGAGTRLLWTLGQESRIEVTPVTNMFGKLKNYIYTKVLKFNSALTLFSNKENFGFQTKLFHQDWPGGAISCLQMRRTSLWFHQNTNKHFMFAFVCVNPCSL